MSGPSGSAGGPAGAGRPILRLLSGEEQGRVVVLEADEVTLGRGEDAAVVLRDGERTLSRIHARILRQEDGRFAVTGLGTNATLVAGVDAAGRQVVLRHGDVVHLGKLRLRFEHEASRPGASPAGDAGTGARFATHDLAGRRRLMLLGGGLLVWTSVIVVVLANLRGGGREGRRPDAPPTVGAVVAALRGTADETQATALRVADDLRTLVPEADGRADVERRLLDAMLLEGQGRVAEAVTAWQGVWEVVLLVRRGRTLLPADDGPAAGDAFGAFVQAQLDRLDAGDRRRK